MMLACDGKHERPSHTPSPSCTRERNLSEAVTWFNKLQMRDEQCLNKLLFPDMASNGGATGKKAYPRLTRPRTAPWGLRAIEIANSLKIGRASV
jgi:hypothetical protein